MNGERERGMAMKGKALMVDFDERQEEDQLRFTTGELDFYGVSKRGSNVKNDANSVSTTSSFVPIGSFSKPVVLPPPPAPGLNPSSAHFLFKELKLSDVGQAHRIIIPKPNRTTYQGFDKIKTRIFWIELGVKQAHAEKYLPSLTDGDGIFIYMDDMDGTRVWVFRFRYWQNNNSRMFVLEKTGDFVKAHGLGAGDAVLIYKDEQTGRYGIQAMKCERKQLTKDVETVPMSCYGNFFQRDEIGAYAYPEYNMQNFMMNFLGGPELTVPNVEQSMSFEPANINPHYYF